MLTVTVGKTRMTRHQNFRGRGLQCIMGMVAAVVVFTLVLQKSSSPLTAEWRHALSGGSGQTSETLPKQPAGSCAMNRNCPEDQFSFFVQSGAANIVPPKICVQNNLVLGAELNNAGFGINVVIINGKTGDVTKTGHFDMYAGDVKPLVELLQSVAEGSAVLMASYDEPSSKLNENAKKLISDLGSSAVQSLGFRDNWVFVGGKGAAVKTNFEKHLKNDNAKNKYENWPELIELQGCLPRYLQ